MENMKIRTALYIRVSTEEQVMHGYSLDAQRQSLLQYAHTHQLHVVDTYIDEGKSARKKYQNRKEFMRMLQAVESDQIDLILFIKLDRWFRSVKDYYKIQEILEAHHVNWKTTEEHYDTSTTNGRLYINIRLSVAQDESDRDSDRIKFVFNSKISRGEAIFGKQNLPLGLTIEHKKIVPDPQNFPIIQDLFSHYYLHQNKNSASRFLLQKYDLLISPSKIGKLLSNSLFKGSYRNNDHYCEPIISPTLFNQIQSISQKQNTRKTPTNRIYLFSGLVICSCCGHKMSGRCICKNTVSTKEEYRYRCNHAANLKVCPHNHTFSEKELENILLQYLSSILIQWVPKYKISNQKVISSSVHTNLKRKLSRLKQLYLEDLISLENYQQDYQHYSSLLSEAETPVSTNPKPIASLLQKDFISIYQTIIKEHKRVLIRSILKNIYVNENNQMQILFYE